MQEQNTSNRKGELAVFKMQIRALELGFIPSIPSIICRYDALIDDGSKVWRVQVKYANGKPSNTSGSVVVKLEYNDRSHHSYTYKDTEVDALVVYIPRIDRLCWFPPSIFSGKKRLSVRISSPVNGQVVGINRAEDYFW